MKHLLICALFAFATLSARAEVGTPVVQESGTCRFLLHQYNLSARDQAMIDMIITDLLHSHEQAFGFTNSGDLRIQIRIFGREQDYVAFARTNHVSADGRETFNTNVAGYYSGRNREVVTWRQRNPSYLANNILHECSHAIMRREYSALPVWLVEGCAVYFEFPRYMRDQNDERQLRHKWTRIKKMLDDGALPDLRGFLNSSPAEFRGPSITRNYTAGWSLFQLLMSTPENRQAMNEMLGKYQAGKNPDCAALMDATYPGGLSKMESDWKAWIARGAANVLGSKAK